MQPSLYAGFAGSPITGADAVARFSNTARNRQREQLRSGLSLQHFDVSLLMPVKLVTCCGRLLFGREVSSSAGLWRKSWESNPRKRKRLLIGFEVQAPHRERDSSTTMVALSKPGPCATERLQRSARQEGNLVGP